MTVQEWLQLHNLLNLSERGRDMASPLTVGEEQAVVDPVLKTLRPGYTGGDMNTAGKYQMVLQYLNQLLPAQFNTPIPRADVVRAGNEWGYIGAVPGDDPGPAHGLRIPGVGPGRDGRYLEALLKQRNMPAQSSRIDSGAIERAMPAAQSSPQVPRQNLSGLASLSSQRAAWPVQNLTSSAPQSSPPASQPVQEAVTHLAQARRAPRPPRSRISMFGF